MSFPRYERYKDSRVEWLGEVPEHWSVERLKNTTRDCRNGIWGADPTEDGWDIACVRVADFDRNRLTVRSNIPTLRNVTESERLGRTLHRGDLLLEKSGGGDLQPVGCVVLYDSEQEAVCSNFVARMTLVEGFDPSFCRYLHATLYALRLPMRSVNQTSGIQNLDQSAYLNEAVAFPFKEEQIAIANFLDQETAKIDALVEEQRRLIALLKEKRQAVISHAVTKGLNPAVSTHTPGSADTEATPRHWGFVLLKRELSFLTSGSRGWADHYADDGAIFIRIGNLTRDTSELDLSDIQRVSVPAGAEGERTRVKGGDLLFSITAFLGSVAVVPESFPAAFVSQHVALARLRGTRLLPKWVAFTAMSAIGQRHFDLRGYGGTKIQLSLDDIAEMSVPNPPLRIQQATILWLERQLQHFARLAQAAEDVIRLLQERRSALISAAVTGKIDVRAYERKPVASAKSYSTGFARQLLAAEVLSRCNDAHMGRTKLQKLIHLTEHHAQLTEIKGEYTRKLAGPLDMGALQSITHGLKQQRWFKEVKQENRYRYEPLDKAGQHTKYLERWTEKQPQIDAVLTLLGSRTMRQCEIVSTLYAAWNDLILDGVEVADEEILRQASTAEGWHAKKERISPEKWAAALAWMKDKELVPTGFGLHTRKLDSEEVHEPA